MCVVHVLVCMCVTVHTEACKRGHKTSGTLLSKPFAVDFFEACSLTKPVPKLLAASKHQWTFCLSP